MAKAPATEVTSDVIERYIRDASGFAFELSCLSVARQLDFNCQHSATYVDPVTGLHRECDIRAEKSLAHPRGAKLLLAVECKSIAKSFPLVVLRTPRKKDEAYHHVVEPTEIPGDSYQVRKRGGVYREQEYVGRSCDQVGLTDKKEITASDKGLFEKWTQSLASLNDLVLNAMGHASKMHVTSSCLILPVVVIPNGTLWCVDFDNDGNTVEEPTNVDRCSYYVGTKVRRSQFPGVCCYTS